MSTWHGVCYPIRPGTEREVADLFRSSSLSDLAIRDRDGLEVGRLLSMMAFVGSHVAVRIVQIDGSLPQFIEHISRSGDAAGFQEAIGQYLAVPRDMTAPGRFFRENALRCIVARP